MIDDGLFRTHDLALATILNMSGYRFKLEYQLGSTRYADFIFDPNDEEANDDLEEIVTDYKQGDYAVEPRGFVEAQKVVRETLYDFLGTRGNRRIAS
jgi:hypothetical protein